MCLLDGIDVESGTGMQIIQGLSVAKGTIVGASGCVVKNIDYAGTYMGMHTRKIK